AVYAHYGRDRFYNAHPKVFVTYKGGHNKVHGSHYAHMGKPAPAPVAKHNPASMPDRGARVMNDKGHNMGNHNMGNHNNAHKAPNREVAMNTRSNRSGSGHFGARR
ncbi:MAG: hypothetical protein IKY01_00020, partial [Prevotella sp.]|nr:hypothetical protein [Prevotella sp.]